MHYSKPGILDYKSSIFWFAAIKKTEKKVLNNEIKNLNYNKINKIIIKKLFCQFYLSLYSLDHHVLRSPYDRK